MGKVTFDDYVIINEIPNENNGRKVMKRGKTNYLRITASNDLVEIFRLLSMQKIIN